MTKMYPAALRSLEQYMETRDDRLKNGEIQNQSVYAFLGRFATGPIEAIRLPIRIETIQKIGAAAVKLCLLDMDFNVWSTSKGKMEDGLWRPSADDPFTLEYGSGRKDHVVEGYMLDYDDGLGMPTVEAAQSIKSPQELIGAGLY